MPDETPIAHARRQTQLGFAYGLTSYLWWGFIPVYFKLLKHVPALIVLSHRVVWSFLFLVALSALLVRWDELKAVLRNKRTLLLLAFSTVLLATNWGVFIWAVQTNRVLQGSLGYFINPIVSVMLGITLLKERLRPWQIASVAIAAAGVIVLTISRGQLPGIALAVAFSFAGYGLVRKVAHVGPLVGVMIETAFLLPLAIPFLLTHRDVQANFDHFTWGLLLIAGIVTAVPLLAFTAGMRRLRMSTMGFLQYVGPTCQGLLAVFVYHEPFRRDLPGFICIWVALIVYTIDSLRAFTTPIEPTEI